MHYHFPVIALVVVENDVSVDVIVVAVDNVAADVCVIPLTGDKKYETSF